ncbi:MAG: helix-turn-helix domain-containing protein [Halobacteriota archaeon]|uniref:helix-turn-helix domain-containing protein n=1 Tax=Halodesulfurarchaeum sp. HSR-GB TaxID=3074077 RepID=UPI002858B751|nr:helix-turn-helix domain-containing protein [Halodesulfurarchaeum sp. HSR-GB]MDR5656444.1 helix-turn-helix domain-containing protein [Halodesulfurarchaeum sp. HSR-GB]
MPVVELTITMPPDSWVAEVTGNAPETTLRVLTVLIDDGVGHAVLEAETTDPGSILACLQAQDSLTAVDLLSVDERRGVFQIETAETAILEPFLAAGVPLETPIHIQDGVATWQFTTSQGRLSALSTHLQESGLSYRVDRIGDAEPTDLASGPGLTDRQRTVFAAAYGAGYFEIPREATIGAVAEQTDVSKSTASEILRRAVRNIVEWYAPDSSADGRPASGSNGTFAGL